MKLTAITLRNFRGVGHSRVEFGPGVTIVAGPNEVGKSSLAEAIRLVRAYKHGSTAAGVRAVQPVGRDVGPEVELEFTTHGHEVWVHKRWLRGAMTELRISGAATEQVSGDAAHERLTTFLAEHLDVELFDALEVIQGQSLEGPEFVGLRSLTQALDASGTPVADHDELLERIEAEYNEHYTKTGRARGRYAELDAEVAELTEELDVAREASREMDQYTQEVERETGQLAADQTALTEARAEHAKHRARDLALADLREAVNRAEKDRDVAELGQTAATAALAAREKLVADAATREDQHVAALAAVVTAAEDLAGLTTAGQDLLASRDVARERLSAARTEASERQEAVNRALDLQELRDFTTREQEAEAAHQRRVEAAEAIARSHVDSDLLEEILTSEGEAKVAHGAQVAALPQVRIEALGDAPVTVAGLPVAGERSELVRSEILIEAPGVVRVEVTPGAVPGEVEQRVREAEDALAAALARGKVTDVAEARAVARIRAEAEAEQRLATQALDSALGTFTLVELQEGIAGIRARLGIAPDTDAPDAPAELAHLRERAEAAREEVTAAEGDLAVAQQAAADHEARVGEARADLIRAETDRDRHKDELDRATTALTEARKETTDEALAADLARAKESLAAVAVAQKAAEDALAEANPDAVAMELRNAAERETSAEGNLACTESRLAKAQTLVEDRTRRGLYDEVQRLDGQLQAAQEELRRVRRRAEAVRLLREVMHRHRDAAHARYIAPFADQIESFGRVVFGRDFAVEITPDLKIASRTMAGQTVPFASLSAGAREQLNLLGRLAAATLVDPVDGAPLLLDDTLGFADIDRLAALGAVINDVGKNAQVIILTCQPHRFTPIGGAELVHLSPTGTSGAGGVA